jgi:hypothetical protein
MPIRYCSANPLRRDAFPKSWNRCRVGHLFVCYPRLLKKMGTICPVRTL